MIQAETAVKRTYFGIDLHAAVIYFLPYDDVYIRRMNEYTAVTDPVIGHRSPPTKNSRGPRCD